MSPERLLAKLAFGRVDKKRRSGGQAASLASTTKMHLKAMDLPTDDKDWKPLTEHSKTWWELINNKPHEVSSGPAARATKRDL